MRKQIIGAALLATTVFGVGYVTGQTGGIGAGHAASGSTSPKTDDPSATHLGGPQFGGHRHGPHGAGQVTAISGDTLTIKPLTRPNDTDAPSEIAVTSVALTPTTTYHNISGAAGQRSDIKVGQFVFARGTLSADGKTLTAATVLVSGSQPTRFGGPDGFRHAPGAGGQVTAVDGNTITVKPITRPNDTDGNTEVRVTTITLTATTTYLSAPGVAATASDIKVGSFVMAQGTPSADGKSLSATRVFVSAGAPTMMRFHGMWHHDAPGSGAPDIGTPPGA